MIQLYDKSNIETLEWPNTSEAKQARDLLLPMLEGGVETYIENVKTRLYILQIDQHVLPITVNDREYENSYLTSNYFAINYLKELLSQKRSPFYFLQKAFVKGLGMFLKGAKINKIVIVNNWLLTTNIYPELTPTQLNHITEFIKGHFSDHLIIFRSLNSRKCSHLASCLKKQHYRVVGSRFVYFYDPEQKAHFSSKVFYHHRRDRRLIETHGYEVFDNKTIQPYEINVLLKLYNHVYLSRHTKYSPQYTEKYLRQAIEKNFFKIIGLRNKGEIQGVMGCYVRNGTMIIPFFGYDTEKGEPNHLYRMLMILAIDKVEKEGVILNDGSGSSAPKKYRGMKPFPEYVAFYDRHLPFHRRFFWAVVEKAVNKIAFPLVEKRMRK